MITCKQVASLLSSGDVPNQSFLGRMELRLHLFFCRHCSAFAGQIKFLRLAAQRTKDCFEAELRTGGAAKLESRLLRNLRNPEGPKE